MRPFAYSHPEDANGILVAGSHPAAAVKYLAGGTNLLDLMKLDVERPDLLVDLDSLQPQFHFIEADEKELRLGAMTRMAEAADDPIIRRDWRVIADSLWQAASPQLRNMATLGGNVLQRTRCNYFRDTSWDNCNKRRPGSGCAAIDGVNRRLAVLGVSDHCIAHYPGDFGVALAALGAEVDVLGPDGPRKIPFENLHRLPGDTPDRETDLRPGELIVSFTVPNGPWVRRSLYRKIRDRASWDFALASAAVALDLAEDGTVRTARIGLGGVAAKPWRSHEAEQVLTGKRLDEAIAMQAADAAFAGAVTHGGNDAKPELGRRTLVRALLETQTMELA